MPETGLRAASASVPAPTTPAEIAVELTQAVHDLNARGLYKAAQWAAEQLVGLELHASPAPPQQPWGHAPQLDPQQPGAASSRSEPAGPCPRADADEWHPQYLLARAHFQAKVGLARAWWERLGTSSLKTLAGDIAPACHAYSTSYLAVGRAFARALAATPARAADQSPYAILPVAPRPARLRSCRSTAAAPTLWARCRGRCPPSCASTRCTWRGRSARSEWLWITRRHCQLHTSCCPKSHASSPPCSKRTHMSRPLVTDLPCMVTFTRGWTHRSPVIAHMRCRPVRH